MTGFLPDVVTVSGANLWLVVIVALIALGAIGMAVLFRSQVLAAGEGTDNMKNIALAVQEGASAYLGRQFRTLGIFAAVAFLVLLALPADDWGVRIGRSVFFLLGARTLMRGAADSAIGVRKINRFQGDPSRARTENDVRNQMFRAVTYEAVCPWRPR